MRPNPRPRTGWHCTIADAYKSKPPLRDFLSPQQQAHTRAFMPVGWKKIRILTAEEKAAHEDNVLDAILEYEAFLATPVEERDENMSLRQIAKDHALDHTTLLRRHERWTVKPWHTSELAVAIWAMGPNPPLTAVEEDELARQCIHMADRGFGLSLTSVRRTVLKIVSDGRKHPFGPKGPGHGWWAAFQRRQPQVGLKVAELLQFYKQKNLTREMMDKMYDAWDKVCTTFYGSVPRTPRRKVWNWDEKPLAMAGEAPLVVAGKGKAGAKGGVRKLSHGVRENATALICVNQEGDAMPPHFLVKGTRLYADLAEHCHNGTTIAVAPKATMTCATKQTWVQKHFWPNLPEKPTREAPVIAQVDGHCSNVDLVLLDWCAQHHIHLFGLPSNTSIATQVSIL